MDTKETNLMVVEKHRIFNRIIYFFKRLVNKKEEQHIISPLPNENKNNIEPNDFLDSIKHTEDPDLKKLLKIQDDLEKMGINKENAELLTKDLSETQKQKLLELYKEQIASLNASINSYKQTIISIRKRLQAL